MDADVSRLGLNDAVVRFRQALTEIEGYARTETYDNFVEMIREALTELDRAADGTAADWGDARYTGFDPRRLSIMSAAGRASVFGGMGSWNDLGGGEAHDKVPEALYSTLKACIMALADSTCAR
jgi:hypothetical protein